jgi:hypothetical protein
MLYRKRQDLEKKVHDLEVENARLKGVIEGLKSAPVPATITYPALPPYYVPTPCPTYPYPTAPQTPWYYPIVIC